MLGFKNQKPKVVLSNLASERVIELLMQYKVDPLDLQASLPGTAEVRAEIVYILINDHFMSAKAVAIYFDMLTIEVKQSFENTKISKESVLKRKEKKLRPAKKNVENRGRKKVVKNKVKTIETVPLAPSVRTISKNLSKIPLNEERVVAPKEIAIKYDIKLSCPSNVINSKFIQALFDERERLVENLRLVNETLKLYLRQEQDDKEEDKKT